MPPQPISVFVADSQPLFRYGLLRLLEAEPGLSVIGSAATEAELVKGLRQFEPDVLFLDLALGAENHDVLRQVTRLHPDLRVIVTASIMPDPRHLAGVGRGASFRTRRSVVQ